MNSPGANPLSFRLKSGISIAWLQICKEWRRLIWPVLGIAFAVVLLMVQLGIKEALLKGSTLLWSHLKADIVLINPQYQSILSTKQIDKKNARAPTAHCSGGSSINFLHFGAFPLRNPESGMDRDIFLIGFDPTPGVFDLSLGVDAQTDKLTADDAVLFDEWSRTEFGPIADNFRKGNTVISVYSTKKENKLNVAGLFKLGPSFAIDGTVLANYTVFRKLLGDNIDLDIANMGLVMLGPGQDAVKTRDCIKASLPDADDGSRSAAPAAPDAQRGTLSSLFNYVSRAVPIAPDNRKDLDVLTKDELMAKERRYWEKNTPIGSAFHFGVVIAALVGLIIVTQIFFTDISDHMSEYATLKAIGYPDYALYIMVMAKAGMLSVIGFLVGLVVAWALYFPVAGATLLPMEMTLSRCLWVYLLTAAICMAAGVGAALKLKGADLVNLFK